MPEFIYILLGGCKLQSWIIYYCSQHLFASLHVSNANVRHVIALDYVSHLHHGGQRHVKQASSRNVTNIYT